PEQLDSVIRHLLHVAHIGQHATVAVIDQLRHSAHARSDGGNFAGHGFERRQAEALQFAGNEHEIGDRQLFLHAFLLAEEQHAIANAFALRQPLGGSAFGPVPDHEQPRRNALAYAIKNLDHVLHALDWAEIGKMHQQTLMLAGKLCAPLLGGGVAQVKIAIHEVGNHFDGMAHVKLDHRAVAQVIGDGSYAVALLDAEAGYR